MLTVITSKEPNAIAAAKEILNNAPYSREDLQTKIIWTFKNESAAAKYAQRFMECGFNYVQRI